MTLQYAVGIRVKNRADQVTVEAEDALIAALKIKAAHPDAAITYVRKQNARGDRRHPHSDQVSKAPAEPLTTADDLQPEVATSPAQSSRMRNHGLTEMRESKTVHPRRRSKERPF